MSARTITIPQLSAKALVEMLDAPGWITVGPQEQRRAARLAERIGDGPFDMPAEVKAAGTQRECRKANAAWCNTPVTLEVSVMEHETVRRCVEFFSKGNRLPGGPYTEALLSAFGFELAEGE